MDTVVLDTNADNLISLDTTPSIPVEQPATSYNKSTSGYSGSNPFIDELKTKLPPKSAIKDSRVSFDEEDLDDEAADTLDDNFLAQRAHFQKFKSHSSATKRLLLNVCQVGW